MLAGLMVLFMIILFMLSGFAISTAIKNPNSKGQSGLFLFSFMIAAVLCAALPVVRDAETLGKEHSDLIKEAMGKTEYKIVDEKDGFYRILTDDGLVFCGKIKADVKLITEHKKEGNK